MKFLNINYHLSARDIIETLHALKDFAIDGYLNDMALTKQIQELITSQSLKLALNLSKQDQPIRLDLSTALSGLYSVTELFNSGTLVDIASVNFLQDWWIYCDSFKNYSAKNFSMGLKILTNLTITDIALPSFDIGIAAAKFVKKFALSNYQNSDEIAKALLNLGKLCENLTSLKLLSTVQLSITKLLIQLKADKKLEAHHISNSLCGLVKLIKSKNYNNFSDDNLKVFDQLLTQLAHLPTLNAHSLTVGLYEWIYLVQYNENSNQIKNIQQTINTLLNKVFQLNFTSNYSQALLIYTLAKLKKYQLYNIDRSKIYGLLSDWMVNLSQTNLSGSQFAFALYGCALLLVDNTHADQCYKKLCQTFVNSLSTINLSQYQSKGESFDQIKAKKKSLFQLHLATIAALYLQNKYSELTFVKSNDFLRKLYADISCLIQSSTPSSGKIHQEFSQQLRLLLKPYSQFIEIKDEYLSCGCFIDIALRLTQSSNWRLAIEINGIEHYRSDKKLRPAEQFRQRLLEYYGGWQVINFCWTYQQYTELQATISAFIKANILSKIDQQLASTSDNSPAGSSGFFYRNHGGNQTVQNLSLTDNNRRQFKKD